MKNINILYLLKKHISIKKNSIRKKTFPLFLLVVIILLCAKLITVYNDLSILSDEIQLVTYKSNLIMRESTLRRNLLGKKIKIDLKNVTTMNNEVISNSKNRLLIISELGVNKNSYFNVLRYYSFIKKEENCLNKVDIINVSQETDNQLAQKFNEFFPSIITILDNKRQIINQFDSNISDLSIVLLNHKGTCIYGYLMDIDNNFTNETNFTIIKNLLEGLN